ncbi:hypothetical protein GTA08_BOTSDO04733 [Botryosphaeria dothidea]|uniref:Uncharacterized protein n=1 Tax=Botryosphaeria dothidea TaxID=55169 RepID=A0A8H4IXK2_9PEZI|nr:hypothetical protein GTA08_BOTSDO04733 [Botryosphaeria dothidea]
MPRGTTWTPELNERLFLVTMEVCELTITGEQYKIMAEKMGNGLTAEALRHRFKKFKKEHKAADGADASPAKGATPKSKATKAGGEKGKADGNVKTSRSSPLKREAKSHADAEMPESPTKKTKHEAEV